MIHASARVTRSRMRELSKQGRKAAARRNKEIVEVAEEIAHQLCPKDTGDLDSTIRAEVNERTGSVSLVAGGAAKSGRDVDYAAAVEWGSNSQPFITPAMESAAKQGRNRRIRMYR